MCGIINGWCCTQGKSENKDPQRLDQSEKKCKYRSQHNEPESYCILSTQHVCCNLIFGIPLFAPAFILQTAFSSHVGWPTLFRYNIYIANCGHMVSVPAIQLAALSYINDTNELLVLLSFL